MAVKRTTKKDGIFRQERVSCSIKDTPRAEFEAALKEMLIDAGRLSTAKGRMAALEAHKMVKAAFNLSSCLLRPEGSEGLSMVAVSRVVDFSGIANPWV